jgi:hypothetical protein
MRNIFERLACKSFNDELEENGVTSLPSALKEAIKKEMKANEEKELAEIGKEVVRLLKVVDLHVENSVKRISDYRRDIASIKSSLRQMNVAKAYALETNNFFPLLKATYQRYDDPTDKKLFNIPQSFIDKYNKTNKEKKE